MSLWSAEDILIQRHDVARVLTGQASLEAPAQVPGVAQRAKTERKKSLPADFI